MGMIVLFVCSLVFTSCSKQETILAESLEETAFIIEKRNFVLPIGYENKSEGEIELYFNNLDVDGFDALEKSFQVRAYLVKIGKLELVTGEMLEGALYSDVDLSKYLTEREEIAMSDFKPTIDNSRNEYRVFCGPSGWCSTPVFQIWRRCNNTYYGFCSYGCNYF